MPFGNFHLTKISYTGNRMKWLIIPYFILIIWLRYFILYIGNKRLKLEGIIIEKDKLPGKSLTHFLSSSLKVGWSLSHWHSQFSAEVGRSFSAFREFNLDPVETISSPSPLVQKEADKQSEKYKLKHFIICKMVFNCKDRWFTEFEINKHKSTF